MAIIALDVGGTSIKSAVVDQGRVLGERLKTPIDSQAEFAQVLGTFRHILATHLQNSPLPITGIGAGFPAPFDYASGTCYIAPELKKYQALYGVNLPQVLPIEVQGHVLPWRFRNDAESAIAGEAQYGAGRPYRRLIGVTLGTGFGSVFWAEGQAIRHGIGQPAGELYAVPVAGQIADDVFSVRGLLGRLAQAGRSFSNVQEAGQVALDDPQTAHVFAQFGADLGDFLRPFVAQFQAEAVLVLGGIAGAYDLFAPTLHLPVPHHPPALGMDAPLLGAADLFA